MPAPGSTRRHTSDDGAANANADRNGTSSSDATVHGAPSPLALPAGPNADTDAAAGGAADPADAEGAPAAAPSEAEQPVSSPLVSPATPLGERAPRVAVLALSGPHDGAVFQIATGSGIIGRLAPGLAVALPEDQWVSRQHAQLTYREGRWWLADLDSTNGTELEANNQSIAEEVALVVGAIFRVGHTDLVLSDKPDLLSQGAVEL